MRTLRIIDGDLVIKDGTFATVEGDNDLTQSVEHTLRTAKGEWFLDEEHGLERDAILGKFLNEEEATDAIIEAVTQDDRIASVEGIAYTFDKATRTIGVTMTLRKADDTTIDVEVAI